MSAQRLKEELCEAGPQLELNLPRAQSSGLSAAPVPVVSFSRVFTSTSCSFLTEITGMGSRW